MLPGQKNCKGQCQILPKILPTGLHYQEVLGKYSPRMRQIDRQTESPAAILCKSNGNED